MDISYNKITGLMNMGNTCFMNSSLQILLLCDKLVYNIINTELDNNDDLIKYKRTFFDYYHINTNTLGPKILYNRYKTLNQNYKGLTQEDVHEYLTFIIEDIHELSKRNNLDIKTFFNIELESRVTCLECNHFSSMILNENILSLNVGENITLHDCFEHFFKPEVLDESNQWFCDKCNKKTNSQKSLHLRNIPEYFFIGLNRISFDMNNLQKKSNSIDYPLELSLLNKNYQLKGIIFHVGNILGGHYFCAVTKNNNEWYTIDDTNIMHITYDKLQQLQQYTYMLMYQII